MMWVKLVNLTLIVLLVLLLRKLVWCIRWLWCYYRGRDVPEPIPFLPQQSGRVFERHLPPEEATRRNDHAVLEEK